MPESKDGKNDARRAGIEVLFEDFYKKKWRVYRMNFIRGIFFGMGSVIGGTVLIAAFIWLISWLVDLPGGIGDVIQFIVDQVRNR